MWERLNRSFGKLKELGTFFICCKPVKRGTIIGVASPCLLGEISSPPHKWSCRLKSPVISTSTLVRILCRVLCIIWRSFPVVSRKPFWLLYSTYIVATNIEQSGSRIIAAVMSEDCTCIYSTFNVLLTYIILRTAHIPSFQIVGVIFI